MSEGITPEVPPTTPAGGVDTKPPRPKLTDTPGGQSIFLGLWIAGTLVVLAAIAGAFVVGQGVASSGEDAPPAVRAEVSDEIPAVFPELTGVPRQPGVWAWSEMRGGECIDGFEGAFAENYTVVECAGSHEAQLFSAELLSRDPAAPFPGEEQVRVEARERCDLRGSVDYSVAGNYSDLIVEYSYPVTELQWERGERGVYCFVLRRSGAVLEADLRP